MTLPWFLSGCLSFVSQGLLKHSFSFRSCQCSEHLHLLLSRNLLSLLFQCRGAKALVLSFFQMPEAGAVTEGQPSQPFKIDNVLFQSLLNPHDHMWRHFTTVYENCITASDPPTDPMRSWGISWRCSLMNKTPTFWEAYHANLKKAVNCLLAKN